MDHKPDPAPRMHVASYVRDVRAMRLVFGGFGYQAPWPVVCGMRFRILFIRSSQLAACRLLAPHMKEREGFGVSISDWHSGMWHVACGMWGVWYVRLAEE